MLQKQKQLFRSVPFSSHSLSHTHKHTPRRRLLSSLGSWEILQFSPNPEVSSPSRMTRFRCRSLSGTGFPVGFPLLRVSLKLLLRDDGTGHSVGRAGSWQLAATAMASCLRNSTRNRSSNFSASTTTEPLSTVHRRIFFFGPDSVHPKSRFPFFPYNLIITPPRRAHKHTHINKGRERKKRRLLRLPGAAVSNAHARTLHDRTELTDFWRERCSAV